MSYAEDPHQQWADEGWKETRHACNENCMYFVPCDIEGHTDVGLCRDLWNNDFVLRQEEEEGKCVW